MGLAHLCAGVWLVSCRFPVRPLVEGNLYAPATAVVSRFANPPEIRLELSACPDALLGAHRNLHGHTRLQEILESSGGDAFSAMHELRAELQKLQNEFANHGSNHSRDSQPHQGEGASAPDAGGSSRDTRGSSEDLLERFGARLNLFVDQLPAEEGARFGLMTQVATEVRFRVCECLCASVWMCGDATEWVCVRVGVGVGGFCFLNLHGLDVVCLRRLGVSKLC